MPTIQLPNGLTMFYRESGSGDRTLLLIHGNVASSRWWERVMAQLPAGVRALAPDLRGCGDSDKPEGAWSMADLADDVYQFAQAMGLARCTVVGHSLGGGVAQQLTVDHPELVERLVLVNSCEPAGLKTPTDKYAQLEVVVKTPDYLKMALASMMPTAPKDEFYELLMEDGVTKSAGAMVRNGHALDGMDLVEQVAAIQVPTLIIWGQQDPLISQEMMERAQRQIPGSLLEIWPEVGHSAPVEDPPRFAQRLVGFMGL